MHDLRDVGGTPGGLGHFLIGLLLAGIGAYLLLDRVTVTSGYWHFTGSTGTSFGVTLIPVLIGIAMLFYDGGSVLGWVLFAGGLAAIIVGLIANMQMHFRATSLMSTLIMSGTLAAGLGLVVRSTRAVQSRSKRE
jgi:hypothetical protein